MKTSFFLFILIGMLAACKPDPKPTSEPKPTAGMVQLTAAQIKQAGIQTQAVSYRKMAHIVHCNGKVNVPPQNLITISLPYSCILKQTDLLEGMHVKKGQSLALVEHPEFLLWQQEYAENKIQLKWLLSELERQKTLQAGNAGTQKTLQKTETDVLLLQTKLKVQELRLKSLYLNPAQIEAGNFSATISIPSPEKGIITKVPVNLGKAIQANEPLFEMVNPEHLHADLLVFEKDISFVKPGQKIRYHLVNTQDQVRTGSVHLIGREIAPERTVPVHGHLEIEDPNLIPGMFLQAEIETGEREMPSVPESAVVRNGNQSYVFVAGGKEGQFRRIPVKTGYLQDGWIGVEFPANETVTSLQIVTEGAFRLLAVELNTGEEE